MSTKSAWIVIALLCIAVLPWSVYRDVQLEKRGSEDLRNRVVGARMEKDGLSPYFYKWKDGDGLRYYDPRNFDTLLVSNVTASPFFHHLLYPIAELPQSSFADVWLIIEYCMLAIMMLCGVLLSATKLQRWLVIITGFAFLFTEAWRQHIANGQNYLFIPFLAMIFYYIVRNRKTLMWAFIAGMIAIVLILIRPNAVVFFVPFLLLIKKYGRNYMLVFVIPFFIAAIWFVTDSNERFIWKQYRASVNQQIKLHQDESPAKYKPRPDPAYTVWEGIDLDTRKRDSILHPQKIYSENGNVFVMARLVFHKQVDKTSLFILSACSIFLLLAVFYYRHYVKGFTLPAVAFAGFAMFMISDLFSPVYRHQYYTVQWLFPLLLAASLYRPVQLKLYCFLAAGLVLNILNIPIIPLEHTIGEYIMLVTFIVLSLRRETVTT